MYNVIIVGGGVFGLTSAYYVKHYNPQFSVALFEKEADVGQGNTSKSVGAYRQGIYTSRANQLLAETTIQYFRDAEERGEARLNMRDIGYLIVMDRQRYEKVASAVERFVAEGKAVTFKPEELESHFGMRTRFAGDEEAEMLNLEDVSVALYAPRCGVLDVDKVVEFYERKCKEVGVEIFTKKRVEKLILKPYTSLGIPREPRAWQKIRISVKLADGEILDPKYVVVAAGSWTPELMDPLGIECFVKPKKRQLYVIRAVDSLKQLLDHKWGDSRPLPVMFFPNGLYIAPRYNEKTFWVSLTDDIGRPFAHDYDPDLNFYYDNVYPLLKSYYPQFENAKPVNMWAGCYSINSLDGNPIAFKVLNCVVVTGGSGSGIQKCDALGRIVEALISDKPYADLYGGVKFRSDILSIENRQVDKEYFIF
jgi:glycine/D-amino acid oxidase-like deaminating enzyme